MVSRSNLISIIQILLMFKKLINISAEPFVNFHQTDYTVTLERYNVLFINKSYFENFETTKQFITRYEKKYSISASLLQDLDAHYMDMHMEGRKFQSNEYRLFPFNYTENSCRAFHYPKFEYFYDNYDCNIKRSCDIKQGYYYCRGMYFNYADYPPHAPRGRFKLTVHLTYKTTILLAAAEYFIEIKGTNPLERTIGA